MINIKFSNYISNILNYNLNTSFPKRFKERVKDWLCSDGDFFKYIDKSDGMDELFYDDVENIDNEIMHIHGRIDNTHYDTDTLKNILLTFSDEFNTVWDGSLFCVVEESKWIYTIYFNPPKFEIELKGKERNLRFKDDRGPFDIHNDDFVDPDDWF